jgi:ubiquinone/menaquinone biosynthesis C-methylase UbiE
MTNMEFKDYFSTQASAYQAFRPGYPDELFVYLATIAPDNTLAWDSACGNGQVSVPLSQYFQKVIATDASQEQINNAVPRANIEYRVATAEHCTLSNHCADLIVVGQALHWFDRSAFFAEAKRVLKPGGILAVWTYNLLCVSPQIDAVVKDLYQNVLGDCWAPERLLVENAYKDIEFPFNKVSIQHITMCENWNFAQLLGYLHTWSAVQAYREMHQSDPLEQISNKLQTAWGGATEIKSVRWPLTLYVAG